MHVIEPNVAQGFIEVTVGGFWDEAHFDLYVADLRAAIAGFPGDKPPMTLYDYSGAAIQTQAVIAKMRALAQHPAMRDRRVALYTDGILARRQARRVAEGRTNMQVFDSRAEALAFLLGDAEPARTPANCPPSGGGGAEGDGGGAPRSAPVVPHPLRQAAPATSP